MRTYNSMEFRREIVKFFIRSWWFSIIKKQKILFCSSSLILLICKRQQLSFDESFGIKFDSLWMKSSDFLMLSRRCNSSVANNCCKAFVVMQYQRQVSKKNSAKTIRCLFLSVSLRLVLWVKIQDKNTCSFVFSS